MQTESISSRTEQWWNYERAAEFGVQRTTLDVAMRDGVTIRCELLRPALEDIAVDGRFPGIIVELTPYAALNSYYVVEAEFFASRGYVALVPLLRGIAPSGGTWGHGGFREAGRDGHDLVEWLAAQPFCDGRIGMYGESYGGQTTYGTAIERPAHLKAIAPMQSPSALYFDVIYPGGIKATERGELDNWPDVAAMTTNGVVDADAEFAMNRAHPAYDEFWRDRSHLELLDRIDVPVLAVGGWKDFYFRSGTLGNIEPILHRTWVVYGPWDHFFPVELVPPSHFGMTTPPADANSVPAMKPGVLLAWMDHWVAELRGVPVPAAPTFTSYEGPPGVGAGWREVSGWEAQPSGLTLCLTTNGTLAAEAGEAGTILVHQSVDPDAPVEAADFTSEPLAGDRVLVGAARLRCTFSLDAPEAHLLVELLDLAPDGTETFVTEGFLAATHRSSHTHPTPAPVGRPVAVTIPVRAHHYRFAAGHRLRVRISGGRPTRLTRPPAPVTIELATGPSATLDLPGFA